MTGDSLTIGDIQNAVVDLHNQQLEPVTMMQRSIQETTDRIMEELEAPTPPEPQDTSITLSASVTDRVSGASLSNVYNQYYQWASGINAYTTTPTQLYGSTPYGANWKFIIPSYNEKALWKEWKKKYKVSALSTEKKKEERLKFLFFIEQIKQKDKKKKEIKQFETNLVDIKKTKRDFEKTEKTTKDALEKSKKQLSYLEKTPEKELMEKVVTVHSNILSLDFIDSILPEDENYFIVKTKPLSVKKESWSEPKIIGSFLLRIPISLNTGDLRILNITQRFNQYDHPCINDTRPCLGNVQEDLREDEKNNDVFEYISDIVNYIQSPHENAGYIKKPGVSGPNSQGWEYFFEEAKPVPKDYDFKKHDEARSSSTVSVRATDPLQTLVMGGAGGGVRPTFQEEFIPEPFAVDQVQSVEPVADNVWTRNAARAAASTPLRQYAPDPREDEHPLLINNGDFEQRINEYLQSLINFRQVGALQEIVHMIRLSAQERDVLFLTKIQTLRDSILYRGYNSLGQVVRDSISFSELGSILREESLYFPNPR